MIAPSRLAELGVSRESRSAETRFAEGEYLPELGARVLRGPVPAELSAELDGLYSSLFCTPEWFLTHEAPAAGALVLEEPRHVLVFAQRDGALEVLNRAFEIAPEDAARACRALFRAYPRIRRIRLEVPFPPGLLPLARRVVAEKDHMVATLPHSLEEYTAALSRHTRKNLRYLQRGLQQDHGELTTETVVPGERAAPLLAQFLEWKVARFRARGRVTYWEEHSPMAERFEQLLRRRGLAHLGHVGGALASIVFTFPVGESVCAQECSFDPRFERYGLGVLSQYETIRDAIGRGARTMDMLWGGEEHKRHFGALPRRYTLLSVFRRPTDRLWSLREEVQVLAPRLKRAARRLAGKLPHREDRAPREGD